MRETVQNKKKICTVTTIKAPIYQTIDFVNYHLNIGIDHMYLFFDNPNDKAIDILKNYEKITCIRCEDKYWRILKKSQKLSIENKQRFNSKIALKMALQKGYDWIAHIDSDELIYVKKPLKEMLKNVGKEIDFIRLPNLEAVPTKIEYKNIFREIKIFRRNFGKFSKKFFKGHSSGKSITRINKKIENLGIHSPVPKKDFKLNYKFSLRGRVLHFDCCGFNDWRIKWKDRILKKTIALEMSLKRKMIFNDFIKNFTEGSERKLKRLYRKQFIVPYWQSRILIIIGVFKKIDLNKKLFKRIYENKVK